MTVTGQTGSWSRGNQQLGGFDFTMTELPKGAETGRNRRQAWRFSVPMDLDIFHSGYSIELPLKDISLTGASVEALGADHMRPDDTCVITLPSGAEVQAQVVS
jgi:hypothetical protein